MRPPDASTKGASGGLVRGTVISESVTRAEIKLLEVNPNPGWCWDGKCNLMAGFQGMRYSELLGQILAAAVERLAIVAKPAQSSAPQVEAAQ